MKDKKPLSFMVDLCTEDQYFNITIPDPHYFSTREEAWAYWEGMADEFNFVLVDLKEKAE